jgi:hypothetical protein
MGLSPRQIDEMTPWEFTACSDAWVHAHGGKRKGKGMDEDDLAELGIEGFE